MSDKDIASDDSHTLHKIIEEKNQQILELRKENNEINKGYQLLDYILALTPNHVYWKDINGKYLGCNDEQARTLGFQCGKDIIGKTDDELPWREGATTFKKIDQEVIKNKKVIITEEESILPAGKKVILYSTKRPLYDLYSGKVIGVLGISVDITEVKLNEKLKHEKKLSEELIDKLGLMASTFAHELRTPIAAIHSGLMGLKKFLPTLVEGYRKAKEQGLAKNIRGAHLKSIENIMPLLLSQVQSCNNIIDIQLKNVSFHEITTDSFTQLSANELIQEAITTYPLRDEERALIHYDAKNDFQLKGDFTLLKHVLWNLLKNAIFYIKSAAKGEVYIWFEQEKDYNSIHFKDTAQGIPAEEKDKIFEKFFTKSLKGTGTGIGLAFSKMVLEAHSGNIQCDSEFGEFTEFILTFPALNLEKKDTYDDSL